MSRELYMGNQALAFGALKAGVNVVSGYPGTPSSEILETISKQARTHYFEGLHVEWSVNEKAALELGAGASFTGARALVTMKQVGLNVASDPLLSLVYLGVKGGLVLVVADDPGPISSQTEQDTRQFAAFAKVPVLDPTTPEEAFKMVQEAFRLSERHGTPVIIRPTTRICHGAAPIEATTTYSPHVFDGFKSDPRWVVFPRRSYQGHLEILKRLPQIAAEFSNSPFNLTRDLHPTAPSHLGIVAGGISFAYLCDALAGLERLGALRLFKVGTPFPFPENLACEFLNGLREVLVFEELEPVIERELLLLAGRHHLPVKILGKLSGHTTTAGENSVATITKQVLSFCDIVAPSRLGKVIDATQPKKTAMAELEAMTRHSTPSEVTAAPEMPQLPARPPVLCAGCPHRASFFAVKRALKGRKAVFGGDIGCYTLGNALPLDMVDTCLCMGAGFTIPQGMSWAEPDVLHLGFVGDSTFFASGLTGVANAVYNQARVTLCILDNSTTAMTGTQPHPGTGIRVSIDADQRDATNALRIPDILSALGVEHIEQVDPFDQPAAVHAVKNAVDYQGVSAVIFKAPCITVVSPKPQPHVDASTCTDCKSCVRSIGCPALVEREGKIAVDTTLCFGCNLCVPLCPAKAIVPQDGEGNA